MMTQMMMIPLYSFAPIDSKCQINVHEISFHSIAYPFILIGVSVFQIQLMRNFEAIALVSGVKMWLVF